MKLSQITVPVTALTGVGASTEKLLANLNIFTVGDLLAYWPKTWDDRTKLIPLAEFAHHKKVNTVAKVIDHAWFGYGRMRTLKLVIADSSAQAELLCFNRPFMEKMFPIDSLVRVNGAFYVKYGTLQSASFDVSLVTEASSEVLPDVENMEQYLHTGNSVLPVYALTAGLSQTQLRKIIGVALRQYAKGIENEIPEDVINRQKLMSKTECVFAMHTPQTPEQAEKARKSLIFEELYLFQKAIGERSLQHRGSLPVETDTISSDLLATRTASSSDAENVEKAFTASLSPRQKDAVARLPFKLTSGQMCVITQINADIDKSYEKDSRFSMARLIQGDVGSGKTLVAFFGCLRICDYGGQCALLAPTELLARQHAENAANLLEPLSVKLAFLTGNLKAAGRNKLLKELKDGNINIVIGTHALFSSNVVYKDLRLAVIDEQHRFGVLQRNAILEKGRRAADSSSQEQAFAVPNLLMMSATPIPQTLALTVFGDLDVSVITTMPHGRLPVKTHLCREESRENVFSFVRKELEQGRQAYFVYPLIKAQETDDTDTDSGLKSAEEMFETLQKKVFPDYNAALIHSQVDEEKQRSIMADFKEKKIQILVATSVVEVGVDVPNATCMVITHAERFGLAALHQLRGRVGRGTAQSHCFLVYSDKLTETGKARLKALYESNDGFVIAEQDLELRGPGEVLGVQQSGYLTLSIADPVRDSTILQIARKEAFAALQASYAT